MNKRSSRQNLQLRLGQCLPQWFSDLFEKANTSGEKSEEGKDRILNEEQTIYFPLKSNSEQRKIIEKLENGKEVLVKGPPGTGKSLTIANLICHLLATNKRILVTAKTPRALQVLHNLLPEEIQPLCVSLIGQGEEEKKNLQKSVSSIHSKEEDWKPLINKQIIHDLSNELKNRNSHKAELKNRIQAIREKDRIKQHIKECNYYGTATEIAKKLSEEEKQFEWFIDEIKIDEKKTISSEEFIQFRKELLFFAPEIIKEISFKFFSGDEIIHTNEFHVMVSEELALKKELEETKEFKDDYSEEILETLSEDKVKELLTIINSLYTDAKTVLNRPYEWINSAVYEILADRDTPELVPYTVGG